MMEALRTIGAVASDCKGRLALTFTFVCGVAISSGILATLLYVLLDLSSMARMCTALGQIIPVGERVRLQSGRMSP